MAEEWAEGTASVPTPGPPDVPRELSVEYI